LRPEYNPRATTLRSWSSWSRYQAGDIKVARLAAIYRVSRPTIYKILARARKQEFIPGDSANKRYRFLAIYAASAPGWALFPEGVPKFDILPPDLGA